MARDKVKPMEKNRHDGKEQSCHAIPFDCIALLLQGGGALGAYQAGVYQALDEAKLCPDWVAGISIGAVNAAIIAGNPPALRIERLREFWELVTYDAFKYYPPSFSSLFTHSDNEHQALNLFSAVHTLNQGVQGFFKPRVPNPWLAEQGSIAATSFYDSSPLKSTLETLVDFDRINSDSIRLNVCAVNVETGNFVNFDNQAHKIRVEHILASGALPPGLPPVEIDGEYFWDGGLISNTPLQWLIENKSYQDTLVFQVDLWSASGEFPQNMAEVLTRQKDIQYSSRTRANTDRFREQHELRHNLDRLLKELPEALKTLPEVKKLSKEADSNVYNIVHLIYRNTAYEGYSKDFEFSRLSMEAHWQKGYADTVKTLKNPKVLERPHNRDGIAIFDMGKEEHNTPEMKGATA